MIKRFAILLIPLIFSACSFAQTTAPSTDIDGLITNLSSTDWSTRQSAQDGLVQLGSRAVDRLKRLSSETNSPEIRQAAQSILARIADDALIAPSLITLHLKDVPPRDAFVQIANQAGTTFRPMPTSLWDLRTWPNVTLDVDGEPFWIAMRKLCDATGLELRVWNDGLRLMQAAGPGAGAGAPGPGWGGGRTVFCGAFLVTLRQCNRSQTIEYGSGVGNGVGAEDAVRREFTLSFRGTAEPRMRILQASYAAHLEEALDDAGNSLLPPEEPPARDPNNPGIQQNFVSAGIVPDAGGGWEFVAQLVEPAGAKTIGKKLKSLRGGVNVIVRTRAEVLEIPDVFGAENVTRESAGAGLKLTLTNVKKLPNRYELRAVIARDRAREANGAADANARMADWQRVQQSLAEIRLIDERGRVLSPASLSTSGGDDSVALEMTFTRTDMLNPDIIGDAVVVPTPPSTQRASDFPKLTWTITTETREIVIPFEFKDVTLP